MERCKKRAGKYDKRDNDLMASTSACNMFKIYKVCFPMTPGGVSRGERQLSRPEANRREMLDAACLLR